MRNRTAAGAGVSPSEPTSATWLRAAGTGSCHGRLFSPKMLSAPNPRREPQLGSSQRREEREAEMLRNPRAALGAAQPPGAATAACSTCTFGEANLGRERAERAQKKGPSSGEGRERTGSHAGAGEGPGRVGASKDFLGQVRQKKKWIINN